MVQSQMNPSQSTDRARQPQDTGFVDQIKSDLMRFSTAFSTADVNTAASFFAPDATLINPIGIRAVGRDRIAQVMQDDMNTLLKGGRSEFRFENCRMLADGLALLDVQMDVKGIKTPDGKEKAMSMHVVTILKKMGDRWMWLDARPYAFLQAPQTSVH